MANTYTLGRPVVITAKFQVPGSNPPSYIDPPTVTIQWKAPGSHTWTTWTFGTDSQVSRVSQGIYTATIPTTATGIWEYGASGLGSVDQGTEQGVFVVQSYV